MKIPLPLLGVACFLIGILLAVGAVFAFYPKFSSKGGFGPLLSDNNSVISGRVDLNGPVQDGETIAIAQRPSGTSDFSVVISDLLAHDGATWDWTEAGKDKTYDLIAYLQKDGQNVAQSDILTVTAPASDEILKINVPETADSKTTVTITGEIDLNGYIPASSTITIVRIDNLGNEIVVADKIMAKDKEPWGWAQASKGQQYTLRAYLKNNNKILAQSNQIVATAPASDEIFTINSTAQPQQPVQGAISGVINLNGSVPDNSRVVLLQRPLGTSNYQVAVDPIPARDGATWIWKNANTGGEYEILAVLKVHQSDGTDKDLAYSANLVVRAPAANEILTINSSYSLNAPSNPPKISCIFQEGSGQWDITVNVDNVSNALNYWIQVGSQSGGTDSLDTKVYKPNESSQTVTAKVNNATVYYARYAYALCSNCSNNSFSAFSGNTAFSCPAQASPNPSGYTGYKCDYKSGCQLTTDPNAPYSFNNQGLAQCQAACRPSPTPTATPTPTPTPTPQPSPSPDPSPEVSPSPLTCNESLPEDQCQAAGGIIRCLDGPCVCVCP